LEHATPGQHAEVHRFGDLLRRAEAEVRRHAVLEARLRAAAVLAARCGAERRHADVVPAAPVAGDLAERREAHLPAVRCNRDAVDPGAADEADAPTARGPRPEA